MCCTWLAGNAGPKKSPKIRHLGTIAQLRATKAPIDSRKKMLNSNDSPTCPHNMVNFGPLAAEICWRVWGIPFQRVWSLGSVTARHSSSGREPNFAALNRGRHLYSAGRPSRWALAHILVFLFIVLVQYRSIYGYFIHLIYLNVRQNVRRWVLHF